MASPVTNDAGAPQHGDGIGRRAFLASLAAGGAGALAGCSMKPPGAASGATGSETGAPKPDDGGPPVIGVSAIDLTSPFFVEMRKAGQQAAADYGVRTVWQSAEGSVQKQVTTIQNYVNQRVDAILVDPLDKNALRPVINQATRAGIPIVTMGNKVEAKGNYSTLYRDAENMAMVAKATGARLAGKGKVALLVGARGNYVSDTREQAFREALTKAYPNIDLVSVQPTAFDARQASNITVTWLTSYPELDAVACVTDSLCLAAKSTAASLQRPDLTISGHDGSEIMNPLLEDGSMTVNVLTGAGRVGYWNVAVGARLAKGAELPRELYMRSWFITTDQTAGKLRKRGLSFPYVTPEEAVRLAQGYRKEFGPKQPDSALSVGRQ